MHILSNRARLIMGLNDTNIYEGSMGFSHKFLGLTYWYMTGLGGGGVVRTPQLATPYESVTIFRCVIFAYKQGGFLFYKLLYCLRMGKLIKYITV